MKITQLSSEILGKRHVWLGTFDPAIDSLRVYDAASLSLRGPKAKTNFPFNISNSFNIPIREENRGFCTFDSVVHINRPTTSNTSSNVESFSGPSLENPMVVPYVHQQQKVVVQPAAGDDYRSIIVEPILSWNLPPHSYNTSRSVHALDQKLLGSTLSQPLVINN